MKFVRTPKFDSDFRALTREHQRMFRDAIPDFNDGCERYFQTAGQVRWRKRLRVRPMVGAPSIWEMTWSFTSPDGRATFEFNQVGDDQIVVWRRIGFHDIYRQP